MRWQHTLTIPVVRSVCSRKFFMDPARYGAEPIDSSAVPVSMLSQSHIC